MKEQLQNIITAFVTSMRIHQVADVKRTLFKTLLYSATKHAYEVSDV
jgi:hypothetical protein